MATIALEGLPEPDDECGLEYEFEVYPYSKMGEFDGEEFEETEAVYAFARFNKQTKKFRIVYIGETKNLSERLTSSHHQKDCIEREGSTHVLIHKDMTNPLLWNKDTREFMEEDLMHYRPLCQNHRWPKAG